MFKKIVQSLMVVDDETKEKIKEYEKQGKFNEHVDPYGSDYTKVDENFKYIIKNPLTKIKHGIFKLCIVNPFKRQVIKETQAQVVGRENLKGIKNAIVCCNHVNKMDAIPLIYSLKGHKVYVTAAEFNNMNNFFGNMMKIGGMMPMSSSYSGQKHFSNTVNTLLKKNNYIAFFPEGSEWGNYQKPRPHLRGAYFYAVKNNVPVIPAFITFKDNPKNVNCKQYIVNILQPIYPDQTKHDKENEIEMQAKCEQAWKDTYESFYNKKLIYENSQFDK